MYTSGSEFLLNGKDYIGKYNLHTNGKYYTEQFFIFGTSIQLQKNSTSNSQFNYSNAGKSFIKNNKSFYNKYKFVKISAVHRIPLYKDYQNGSMIRYFIYIKYSKKVKQISKSLFEQIQNMKSSIYIVDSIQWILTGNINYVTQENKRKIENSKIPTLYEYITNYTQFYTQ